MKRLMNFTLLLMFSFGAAADKPFIIMQSTTSTQNSGLLDYLLPQFTQATGIEVRVVAVGTGQALKNARNGDGDVLLVHAKQAEEAFVANGFGVARHNLMYNDFVLVGPSDDPAGIGYIEDVVEVLEEIAASQSIFISRGDDSGTHKKERALWSETSVDVDAHSGTWYRESGSGMGATLNMASGMDAYTLTDRATWINFKNKGLNAVLVEGDQRLFNQYGVIMVNPEKHPHVKQAQAEELINWLTTEPGQKLIASFRVGDQQLFYPNAQ